MNKTVIITSRNHKYSNTYGGNIYPSDFCTDYPNSDTSVRILSDWHFDKLCMNNIKQRNKKYKNYTVWKY